MFDGGLQPPSPASWAFLPRTPRTSDRKRGGRARRTNARSPANPHAPPAAHDGPGIDLVRPRPGTDLAAFARGPEAPVEIGDAEVRDVAAFVAGLEVPASSFPRDPGAQDLFTATGCATYHRLETSWHGTDLCSHDLGPRLDFHGPAIGRWRDAGPPLSARGVLVGAVDSAVDAVPLVVAVGPQRLEQAQPLAALGPSVEALEHRLPGAKGR